MHLTNNLWIEQRSQQIKHRHNVAVWFDQQASQVMTFKGRDVPVIPLSDGTTVVDERRPLKAHMVDWLQEHIGAEGREWRWSRNFRFVSFREQEHAEKFLKWWHIDPSEYFTGEIVLQRPVAPIAPREREGDPPRPRRRERQR